MQDATQDRVRAKAYALWQESGQPDGQDVSFWLEAERQINGQADGLEMPDMPGAISEEAEPGIASMRGRRPE